MSNATVYRLRKTWGAFSAGTLFRELDRDEDEVLVETLYKLAGGSRPQQVIPIDYLEVKKNHGN